MCVYTHYWRIRTLWKPLLFAQPQLQAASWWSNVRDGGTSVVLCWEIVMEMATQRQHNVLHNVLTQRSGTADKLGAIEKEVSASFQASHCYLEGIAREVSTRQGFQDTLSTTHIGTLTPTQKNRLERRAVSPSQRNQLKRRHLRRP